MTSEDLRVLLGLEGSIRMPLVEPSPWPDSSSSGSACVPEPLPDDAFVVSSESAEALERNRPGPMTLEEYASFVTCFRFTAEQLRAIPTAEGLPRFTLDD